MKQQRTSALRKLSIYGFDSAQVSHNFQALLECNITDVRSALRQKRQEGRPGSLFVFLLKTIGKCVEEYPEFNSMIKIREIMNITAIFNHDIVDGAPAARLINQMRK